MGNFPDTALWVETCYFEIIFGLEFKGGHKVSVTVSHQSSEATQSKVIFHRSA